MNICHCSKGILMVQQEKALEFPEDVLGISALLRLVTYVTYNDANINAISSYWLISRAQICTCNSFILIGSPLVSARHNTEQKQFYRNTIFLSSCPQLMFTGHRNTTSQGFIAIDDIQVKEGACSHQCTYAQTAFALFFKESRTYRDCNDLCPFPHSWRYVRVRFQLVWLSERCQSQGSVGSQERHKISGGSHLWNGKW